MSSKYHGKYHPYCLNCHYPISEFDKNCSQCGQKPTDGKTTMHDLPYPFSPRWDEGKRKSKEAIKLKEDSISINGFLLF